MRVTMCVMILPQIETREEAKMVACACWHHPRLAPNTWSTFARWLSPGLARVQLLQVLRVRENDVKDLLCATTSNYLHRSMLPENGILQC